MRGTLPAVFDSGILGPLRRPKGLAEHRRVILTVDAEEEVSSSEDAQEMREFIEREFDRVDPREW